MVNFQNSFFWQPVSIVIFVHGLTPFQYVWLEQKNFGRYSMLKMLVNFFWQNWLYTYLWVYITFWVNTIVCFLQSVFIAYFAFLIWTNASQSQKLPSHFIVDRPLTLPCSIVPCPSPLPPTIKAVIIISSSQAVWPPTILLPPPPIYCVHQAPLPVDCESVHTWSWLLQCRR